MMKIVGNWTGRKWMPAILCMALLFLLSLFPGGKGIQVSAASVEGKITVDGSLSDWSNVEKQSSSDSEIAYWKAVSDADGNLYVCFSGTANTQWYGNYEWKYLTLMQNGKDTGFQIHNVQSQTGGTLVIENKANGNTAAPYYVEFEIPADYITDENFSIKFADATVKASELPVFSGEESEEKEEVKYTGIVIDGEFEDWSAVKKYDAACPNSDHKNCLSKAAMVFDGDNVYIYVEEGKGGSAASAGSHSNGNFEIRTDLGHTLMLHFKNDGTVTSSGSNDIKSRHVGSQWEISIPKADLPSYEKYLSFGLYAAGDEEFNPFVSSVANLDGSGGNAGSFDGIVYDGQYGDWKDYPHSTISYATEGTQEELADAKGALYYPGDGKIFGHVVTSMKEHRDERGGEFAYAVTIRVNRSDSKVFYPRLVTVDSSGNINWNPSFSKDGTYEYYLVDTNGWGTAKTLDELNDGKHGNKVYGKMTMTLKQDSVDECEFYIDSEELAEKLGMKESDLNYVEARFGRIGQQWIGTSGASTNPWLGVGLCIGICALVMGKRRISGKERKPDNAEYNR